MRSQIASQTIFNFPHGNWANFIRIFPEKAFDRIWLDVNHFQCKNVKKKSTSFRNLFWDSKESPRVHWYTLIWSSITINPNWYANDYGFHFMRYQNKNIKTWFNRNISNWPNGDCECKHNALSLKSSIQILFWRHQHMNGIKQ